MQRLWNSLLTFFNNNLAANIIGGLVVASIVGVAGAIFTNKGSIMEQSTPPNQKGSTIVEQNSPPSQTVTVDGAPSLTSKLADSCNNIDRRAKDHLGISVFELEIRLREQKTMLAYSEEYAKYAGLVATDCGFVNNTARSSWSNEYHVFITSKEGEKSIVLCTYEEIWAQKIRTTEVGERVSFSGQLSKIPVDQGSIYMDNCTVSSLPRQ